MWNASTSCTVAVPGIVQSCSRNNSGCCRMTFNGFNATLQAFQGLHGSGEVPKWLEVGTSYGLSV